MADLTRLGKTLKVETLEKTTYLPFGTFRIAYDPSTLEVTVYSVDTAAIVFDGVISNLIDTASGMAFTVPTLEVFIASFNFGGSGGGSITDVTATSPLLSSGGATPNISIDVQPDGVYGISFSGGVATLVTVGGDIVGEIKMFGTTSTPSNYVWCDGSLLPVTTYPQLFAAIGNSYGGDGISNYQLPNFTGSMARGDNGSNIGSTGGDNVLTELQLPAHTHNVKIYTGSAGTSADNSYLSSSSSRWRDDLLSVIADGALASDSVTIAGNNQPHEHPYTTVRYAICVSPFV